MPVYYYDLHIHTALSLCADDDMTPQNIVNLAKLSGLDLIAVSDHNTAGNIAAVIAASKALDGPAVVPAIELTTSEEIHVLLLFRTLAGAAAAWEEIKRRQPVFAKKAGKSGNQLYLDACDRVVGEEGNLLLIATDISVDETPAFAQKYGGVAVPAHADKAAYSVVGVLGVFPFESGFTAAELTPYATDELRESLKTAGIHILSDSDSHFLGILNEREPKNAIELPEPTAAALVDKLTQLNSQR
jgi:hypothetical protein